MPVSRESSVWGKIRVQLTEAQSLVLNGKYAEAMIRDKELLKTLVRLQINRACLVTRSLPEDIDQLFDGGLISKQTKDIYDQILLWGEQAESGAKVSAQAANDSFYLIKEGFESYFDGSTAAERNSGIRTGMREMRSSGARESSRQTQAAGSARAAQSRNAGKRSTAGTGSTAVRQSAGTSSRNRAGGQAARQRSSTAARKSSTARRREEPVSINLYEILKIAIPVACAILLIVLVRTLLSGGKSGDVTQTTSAVATEATMTESAEIETTDATEPETEPTKVYVARSNVNLRSAPNTDAGTQVIRVVVAGTELKVKGDYDADWAIVDDNGTDAYVNKAYIEEQTTSAAATEAETSAETTAAQ